MKRSLFLSGALTLAAQLLCAATPSARTQSRLAYDPGTTQMVLFGGSSTFDTALRTTFLIDQTWVWTGSRWVQRFPVISPSARAAHTMVFETTRSRFLLFGGRTGATAESNDTWVYANQNWSRLDTPNAPGARQLAGMTFDPVRDRTVLFGGVQTSADGKATTNLADTWEFDGTTWTQRPGTGPDVIKPLLQYDSARNQTLMLGMDKTFKTLMYTYDAAAGTWKQTTPSNLPVCVNEGALTFQTHNRTVLFVGGSCENATTSLSDEGWEWDGSNWTKIVTKTSFSRAYGLAAAYDEARTDTLEFGGTLAFGVPHAGSAVYRDGVWLPVVPTDSPIARSLFAFATDPANNAIWLVGGTGDDGLLTDFWKYQNGQFQLTVAEKAPLCVNPNAAFDTDRKKLVVVCAGSDTYEWDGAVWTHAEITDSRKRPSNRRLTSLVYDQTIKKTVLFGGLIDPSQYLDETWVWDGTSWTQIRKNLPTARSNATMWFDPNLKKTVVYGGIGRLTSLDRITRYNDMWTFDGTNWTELKLATNPGIRYGAQAAVDPRTNHLLLFGGLRVDTTGSVQTQTYASDTWDFDGATWKQLSPATVPPARENGAIAYDPSQDRMVMFGGQSGYFLSDVWTFNKNNWVVSSEALRRRRPSSVGATASGAAAHAGVAPRND